MASTDLTTLAVAIVGVAGTMGSPWLSQWARRAELRDQADREARVREEDRIERAFERKRALYANLNRAARVYRSTARDVALNCLRGEDVAQDTLDAMDYARADFRLLQSEAQMVLPLEALPVTDETGRCLALGYEQVRLLAQKGGAPKDAGLVMAYLNGPLSAAIRLLRHIMRADLGVAELPTDLAERLDQLASERAEHSTTTIAQLRADLVHERTSGT